MAAPTLDQLEKLATAVRRRNEAFEDQIRKDGGVWDTILRRWVPWDEIEPFQTRSPEVPSSELLDRLPPQDLDAERWVIGSMIVDPQTIDEIGSMLRPTDFYADVNQRLYAVLLDMRDRGCPIDVGLLMDRLKATGDLAAVGGPEHLGEVMQNIPHTQHAAYYAKIVREKAARRTIIQAGLDMVRDGYGLDGTTAEILGRCEAALGRIETGNFTGDPTPLAQSLQAVTMRADAIREKKQSAGLMTGIYSFDALLGGLFPGELFILAARPTKGKTSLACQMALHIALSGRLVYFASLEMSDLELTERMLCSVAGVNSKRLRTGSVSDEDCRLLAWYSQAMSVGQLVIHDLPGMNVATIRRACRRLKGLALIVVDYLQRVTPTDRKLNRYEQVAEICKGLKTLARELNVPVMCIAQLGRAADTAARPELHHLRESGDIEAEADVVAFLVRNVRWAENDEPSPEKAALVIEKNRNGETATLRLLWEAARTRFCEPDDHAF